MAHERRCVIDRDTLCLLRNVSAIESSCPYCGEPVELSVDDAGGSRQSYVEDCPVCCQPWQVALSRDADGDWEVSLRTTDE
jgi:hypothetical protein